jgi:hypothetical protein
LRSVHEKKLTAEAEKSRLETEAARALFEAREKIQEIANSIGIMFEQLGFLHTVLPGTTGANKPKRRNKAKLDKAFIASIRGLIVLANEQIRKRHECSLLI